MPARRWLFPGLLAGFGIAYVWRMSGVAEVPPITDHLSNFYLTGAALTLAGTPRAFVDPTLRSRVRWMAVALVALNVVVEIVLAIGDLDETVNRAMGDVNTTDPLDGVAGVLAVALVVVLLPRPAPESPRRDQGPSPSG